MNTLEDIVFKFNKRGRKGQERRSLLRLRESPREGEKGASKRKKCYSQGRVAAKFFFNEKWTKDAIEDAGENLHQIIKKGGAISYDIPYLGRQPWQCKWNQEDAILKLKSKKKRKEDGSPINQFLLPM